MLRSVDQSSVKQGAALVCDALAGLNIVVCLTGRGCVAVWTDTDMAAGSLEFVEQGLVRRSLISDMLTELGFIEANGQFEHPGMPWAVEFPSGPQMVGDQRIARAAELETPVGTLRLLSPTDCIKDRLAAFIYWSDKAALDQAVQVARAQSVDLAELHSWADSEGGGDAYQVFREALSES